MTEEAKKIFKFSKHNDQSEIWAIAGGKRGVGVTTFAIGLSVVLQRSGKKVLLIDAADHPGNLDSVLGIQPKFTLVDVIERSATLEATLIKGPSGLEILMNSSFSAEQLFQNEHHLSKLKILLKQIKYKYNYILMDLSSGMTLSMLHLLDEAHKVFLVVNSDPASIADTYAMIKVVKKNQAEKMVVLVPNRVTSEEEGLLLHKKMNLITKSYLTSEIVYGGSIFANEKVKDSNPEKQLFGFTEPTSQMNYTLLVLVRNLLSYQSKTTATQLSLYKRFFHESNQIGLGK